MSVDDPGHNRKEEAAMRERIFRIFQILGALLILIGAGSMLFLRYDAQKNAQFARETAIQIESNLPGRRAGIPGEFSDSEMAAMEINGVDYVGLVEVPSLGIKLPIADQWNSNSLRRFPCRYYGSVYSSDLILGGSNQAGQFDFCEKLQLDDIILVTDMTGAEFRYRVSRIDRSGTADAARLMDGDWSLTLFTADRYDGKYILIRCEPA